MNVLAYTAVKHSSFQLGGESMEAKQRKKKLAQRLCLRVQGSVYQREVCEGVARKTTSQR